MHPKFFVFLLCLLSLAQVVFCGHPVLIVVSFDAFSHEFFHRGLTPNMLELRKSGTYADHMVNVFPTKTFPNHHSIATGLYPESHGVIGNHVYDQKTLEVITYGYKLFHYNEDVIPIWTLNEKQGKGRHSGIMMWPGGNFAYQQINATYGQSWLSGFDFKKRVDKVIEWIMDPIWPANLIMMYFEDPDQHAHIYGPNSNIVNGYIRLLDDVAWYLKNQLEEHNLTDNVNVIHLADHGITSVRPKNFINLTKYVNDPTVVISGSTPDLHYIPDGNVADVYNKLKKTSKRVGHFSVYKKDELPERWHFKNNNRTPPIFVLADDGYGFQDMAITVRKYAKLYNITLSLNSEFGMHGFDNKHSNMWPFFLAYGPKIKKNHRVNPFNTVDLYNLFCEILEIEPVANNGTFGNVQDILVGNEAPPIIVANQKPFSYIIFGIVVLILTAIAIIGVILVKWGGVTVSNKRSPPQDFQPSTTETQNLLENEEA